MYFPILVDLGNLPCLVVGGGKVALRKVSSLLAFNGEITVVTPRCCKGLAALSRDGRIKVIRKRYSSKCIKGQKIVFSATNDPETNRRVSSDCKRAGLLLNVADIPSLCDFIVPAILKRGFLTISVSSQGKAPFFAKEMKKKLSEQLTPSAAGITQLAAEFRRRLLSNGLAKSPQAKAKAYSHFLSKDWENILAASGKRKSYRVLDEILKEVEGL